MASTPSRPASAAPPTVPLSEPALRGNEWRYVKECLDTNWVSSVGTFVDRFEAMVAGYVGARYGVATVNGTAALHVALLAAGVQPDDEVLVSTLSFIAPANAIRYCGAWPVFMDSEPQYWQMDPEKVAAFLAGECTVRSGALVNRATGRRVRAIVPVHILGHPVDLDPILAVARRYDLPVVEDATESVGARYRNRMVGQLGDVACLSFNGNKIITTGGGGMIVTDREPWATRVRYLTTQARDDALEYVHHEIGYNYRLTNIQAAVGVAQMEQLDEFVRIKRRIAQRYAAGLGEIDGLTLHPEAPWATSTFWLYTILVAAERTGVTSRGLQRALSAAGIQSRPLWAPLYAQRPYERCQAYRIEVAPRLYRDALSLPSSIGLDEERQDQVIDTLQRALGVGG